MDGILRCSRYAFGPNRLHYCGPDANKEIGEYIKNSETDLGLAHLMKQFQTMFPYLRHISSANGIEDPFDDKVVEAYWLGNNLLETIEKKYFYNHLVDDHRIPKRIGLKSFRIVESKIAAGAVPHHSFHVLDIWKRTGNLQIEHTLESMDECRISWGKVQKTEGPYVYVETEPLSYKDGRLFIGEPIVKKLVRRLESTFDIEQLKPGDITSIHWGVPCEVINARQLKSLKYYTNLHIQLANKTL
jgi:hypothetical protein